MMKKVLVLVFFLVLGHPVLGATETVRVFYKGANRYVSVPGTLDVKHGNGAAPYRFVRARQNIGIGLLGFACLVACASNVSINEVQLVYSVVAAGTGVGFLRTSRMLAQEARAAGGRQVVSGTLRFELLYKVQEIELPPYLVSDIVQYLAGNEHGFGGLHLTWGSREIVVVSESQIQASSSPDQYEVLIQELLDRGELPKPDLANEAPNDRRLGKISVFSGSDVVVTDLALRSTAQDIFTFITMMQPGPQFNSSLARIGFLEDADALAIDYFLNLDERERQKLQNRAASDPEEYLLEIVGEIDPLGTTPREGVDALMTKARSIRDRRIRLNERLRSRFFIQDQNERLARLDALAAKETLTNEDIGWLAAEYQLESDVSLRARSFKLLAEKGREFGQIFVTAHGGLDERYSEEERRLFIDTTLSLAARYKIVARVFLPYLEPEPLTATNRVGRALQSLARRVWKKSPGPYEQQILDGLSRLGLPTDPHRLDLILGVISSFKVGSCEILDLMGKMKQ